MLEMNKLRNLFTVANMLLTEIEIKAWSYFHVKFLKFRSAYGNVATYKLAEIYTRTKVLST